MDDLGDAAAHGGPVAHRDADVRIDLGERLRQALPWPLAVQPVADGPGSGSRAASRSVPPASASPAKRTSLPAASRSTATMGWATNRISRPRSVSSASVESSRNGMLSLTISRIVRSRSCPPITARPSVRRMSSRPGWRGAADARRRCDRETRQRRRVVQRQILQRHRANRAPRRNRAARRWVRSVASASTIAATRPCARRGRASASCFPPGCGDPAATRWLPPCLSHG